MISLSAGRSIGLSGIVAIVLVTSACIPSAIFGPSLSNLITTTGLEADYRPQDDTDIFYIDSPRICCSAKLSGMHQGTTVNVKWIYIQGDMAAKDNPLLGDETIVRDSDGFLGFTLQAPVSGFISGVYRVELSVDGKQQASGTFHIEKDVLIPFPQINSFSASPSNITVGQPVTLNWKVSNANRITIEPFVGSVMPAGSKNITPAADATYTLYALNRRGSSSNALTINVSPAITTRPDLVITEFWSSGNVISYRIKNIGDAPSCSCESYLYRNDMLESRDYVPSLAPGEERAEAFLRYHFSPRFSSVMGAVSSEASSDAVTIRICANGDRSCPESNGDNNCLEHNYGPLVNINLARYISSAQWQSSTGNLKWPIFKDSRDGFVSLSSAQMDAGMNYTDAISMCPPLVQNAWIQGTFGVLSGQPATLQPFTIPHKCKFSARVGVTREVPASASVKFLFGIDKGGEITYFPPLISTSKGRLDPCEVDLSSFAGQQVRFVLRVESAEPLQQGCAAWIEPVIIQER